MTEIRHEVVVALVAAGDAAQLDIAIAAHEPTHAEASAAARALALLSVAALEDAGVLRDAGTVLDLGQRQLYALDAVYQVVRKWWTPPGSHGGTGDPRTLGDMLKIIPAGDVHEVRGLLIWGGLLSGEEGVVGSD